jgi:hypothetical protein
MSTRPKVESLTLRDEAVRIVSREYHVGDRNEKVCLRCSVNRDWVIAGMRAALVKAKNRRNLTHENCWCAVCDLDDLIAELGEPKEAGK